jgi:hypothetical protein
LYAAKSTCYFKTTTLLTWDNAKTVCAGYGATLATIEDATEDSYVYSTYSLGQDLWLGYNDKAVDGTFVWDSGSTSSYTHWSSGEPNGGTDENCVLILGENSAWNDGTCGSYIYGL